MKNRVIKITAILLCAVMLCSFAACRKKGEYAGASSSGDNSAPVTSAFTQSSNISSVTEKTEMAVSSQTVSSKKASSKTKPAAATAQTQKPIENKPQESASEMRAVWITYLEFDNMLKNKSREQFTKNIKQCFENCKSAGLNTVIVQVRSHGDALYKSGIFPSSTHFTATRGTTFPFDPLEIMITEAHARGLKLHAWINPLRGPNIGDALASTDPFAVFAGTDKIFVYNNYYYLNPAYGEVVNLVINGVKEVVQNYNVDGVHFDDRFYPTKNTDIDAQAFAALGGGKTLGDWRRQNISNMVRLVYAAVKGIKNIPFGISPQGNMENNLNNCFADVPAWCKNAGYADYIAPQLYWAYGEGALPYETALEKWKALEYHSGVSLVAGLAPYKVGSITNWAEGDVLMREVTDARKAANYKGFALYRYENFMSAACAVERHNLKTVLG